MLTRLSRILGVPIISRQSFRPPEAVADDFKRLGCPRIGFATGRYLSLYPPQIYDALKTRLASFRQSEWFGEMVIGHFEHLRGLDITNLPGDFLRLQRRGEQLVLTRLRDRWNAFQLQEARRASVTPRRGPPGGEAVPPPVLPDKTGGNITAPVPVAAEIAVAEGEAAPFRPDQYSAASDVSAFLDLSIESPPTPPLDLSPCKQTVLREATEVFVECTRKQPGQGEIDRHTVRVNDAKFARDGERLVGFGSALYLNDYRNLNGEKEKLTLLWGTMVRPKYRRLGLMIKLNYDLIKNAKEAVRFQIRGMFSLLKRLFVPAPMVVRTQSRAVWEAVNFHFKGIKPVGSRPDLRYQHMIDFTADKYGWQLDGRNVQAGAYESARVEREEDRIPGLGPTDAWIGAGDFTLGKEILTWIYLRYIYPGKAVKRGAAASLVSLV